MTASSSERPYIELSLSDREDPDLVTLSVRARSGPFRGESEVYIGPVQLKKLKNSLEQYPIIFDDAHIEGIFPLDTVLISILPYDARGYLLLTADLSSENEPRQTASVRFLVEYEVVAKFSAQLGRLIAGDLSTARLEGVL
ncbi:MAG TPA: hypothetical protein VK196_10035 [Magnetospirillum sp.]|nr:hypothetical protein [Magnetospirillum sp.]